MKRKKITQLDILYLSISMFVIVVIWIIFGLYHIYVTSTISEDLQMKITPIDGSFDMATIEKLKSRTKVAALSQISTASQSATISPTPNNTKGVITPYPTGGQPQITGTITPTVAASPTAKLTSTP